MKLAGLLTTICLVFGSLSLSAQDLHNTLYDYAPLSVNPANAGNFLGSYRVGGIYRDQFSALSSESLGGRGDDFVTPMFYIDAPLPFAIGKKGHWIGAGLNFQTDKSGILNQETTLFMLAASFNYVISSKKNTYFTVGLQGGMRSRSYDFGSSVLTEEGINGGLSSADAIAMDAALNSFNADGNDAPGADGLIVNAGIKFRTNIDKKTHFHIGLAALNITRPNQSLDNPNSDSTEFRLPLRVNIHAGLRRQLNKKWTLNPTLFVSTIGNQNQAAVQVWGEYLFNEEKNIDFRFGLGHRLGRDIQPLLGINIGDIRIAGSYDVRMGSLGEAINNRGGWEVGVSYVGVIFKKVDTPAVIFCPQF
ncbi:MAG: type IX secretion system PorP/SprF family membrane protein [Saprospiraceae bacterium]|jgi:type IX secretion system PorP/SprF family membrane protein